MTEFDKLCVFLDQFDADHIDFETPIGLALQYYIDIRDFQWMLMEQEHVLLPETEESVLEWIFADYDNEEWFEENRGH